MPEHEAKEEARKNPNEEKLDKLTDDFLDNGNPDYEGDDWCLIRSVLEWLLEKGLLKLA